MSDEKVTCQKIVRKDDGFDRQNKPMFHHEKCGQPASEVVIQGSLTTAKAVLCPRHHEAADRQAYLSENGFPQDKVERKAKEKGYRQKRIQPALAFNTSNPDGKAGTSR